MNKTLLIITFTLLYIVSSSSFVVSYGCNSNDGDFKVLKIKSEKSFYIIYAERNDTLFKILSKKEKTKCLSCEKIRKKKKYYFSLETLFPRYIQQSKCPPPGTTGRMGIGYYGYSVPLETENNIWDMFEATNLEGLYIIKKIEQSSIELFDKPLQ